MKATIITCSIIFCYIATACTRGSSSASGIDFNPEAEEASFTTNQIDSLALNADFLSAFDAMGVLTGYMHQVNANKGIANSANLPTMRKFVDVYDIVSNNLGDEFAETVARLSSSHGIDLRQTYLLYREALADFADGTSVESETTVTASTANASTTDETDKDVQTPPGNTADAPASQPVAPVETVE